MLTGSREEMGRTLEVANSDLRGIVTVQGRLHKSIEH